MAVRMTCFAFSRGAEYSGYVVVALYVSLGCKVKVTAVSLGLTGKCVFQVLFGFAAFQ